MIKNNYAKLQVILSLSLVMTTYAHAALLPPDNLSSQDVSTPDSKSILLGWSAVSGAISYDLSGYETSPIGNIIWSKPIVDKRITPKEAGCDNGGICSLTEGITSTTGAWKVRANDSVSKGDYSSYSFFSLDPSSNSGDNSTGDNDTEDVSNTDDSTDTNESSDDSNTDDTHQNDNQDSQLPPSVISPTGATLSDGGSIPISWKAVPGASSYDLIGYKTDPSGSINWSESIIDKHVTPAEANCTADNLCHITAKVGTDFGAWKIRTNHPSTKSEYTPYFRFSLYEPHETFKIRVKTTTDGVTSRQQFQIPTTGEGYNYNVDCDSDGINEATHVTGNYTCDYTQGGSYSISISGSFPRIFFNNEGDRNKLLFIEQWGIGKWRSMERAFMGCETMTSIATDAPDLSLVTNLSHMFDYALSFDQDISRWDVSTITNMSSMFRSATLSADIYDRLLNGWSQQTLQSNVEFHAGKSQFSAVSAAARQALISNSHWSITDYGTTELNPTTNPPTHPPIDPTNNPSKKTVRILPLGDSITDSINNRPSYRRSLWNQLQTAGYDVDFVGSSSHTDVTPDYDTDHEGHAGWEAGDINDNIAAWLTNVSPDIVLLHIGTNDLDRNQSETSTLTEIDGIIQKLRTKNSSVIILLAKIIPMRNYDTSAFNALLDDFVAARASIASPIVIVDQYTGYDPQFDSYDNYHPDTTGENKMADNWFEALEPFLE